MPTKQEVEEALEAVDQLERVEGDNDHKQILSEVRRMIVGTHNMEMFRDDLDQDKLQTLYKVLESIDAGEQRWHDTDHVETYKDEGMMFTRIYLEDKPNP